MIILNNNILSDLLNEKDRRLVCKRHSITQEELINLSKESILNDYKNGMGLNSLFSKYNIPIRVIDNLAKEAGIKRTNMKISKELKEKAIAEYIAGAYSTDIDEKYNLSKGRTAEWARERGLTRHRGPSSMIKNETYFDIIDTEGKAYFLGLLMADGNVAIHNNQYTIKLSLLKSDRHILESFLKEIESTNKINDFLNNTGYNKISGKETPMSRINLTSIYMAKRLMELGVVPRKSGIESFPKQEVPQKFHKDFLRGYFDGDGTISFNRNNNQVRGSFISSSKDIINEFLCFFDFDKKVHFHGNCFSSHFAKQDSIKIYNSLYKNSTFHLKRKYNIFKDIASSS